MDYTVDEWKEAAKEILKATDGAVWDEVLNAMLRGGATPELDELVHEQLRMTKEI